jgi:hypothetical protein
MCRLAKGLWCGERLVSSTAILVGQWVKSVSRRQQTVKLETGEDRGLGDNIIFFLGFFGGAGDGWTGGRMEAMRSCVTHLDRAESKELSRLTWCCEMTRGCDASSSKLKSAVVQVSCARGIICQ